MISIMDYLPALWRREIKNRIVKIWVQQPLSQRRLGMHFCISISQWRLTKNLRLKIVFVQTKIFTLKTIYLLGSINEKTLAFRDLCALQWRTHCAVNWECELSQKDSTWQRMFQANPKTNLFPICKEYFQKVKQDMNDEELFNHWLKKQKLKYPHRLAYQNINLWSNTIFKRSFYFIPTLSFYSMICLYDSGDYSHYFFLTTPHW